MTSRLAGVFVESVIELDLTFTLIIFLIRVKVKRFNSDNVLILKQKNSVSFSRGVGASGEICVAERACNLSLALS